MLKSAGLVDWKQEGTKSIFSLNRRAIGELARKLEALAKAPA